jgi:hypothetical protein
MKRRPSRRARGRRGSIPAGARMNSDDLVSHVRSGLSSRRSSAACAVLLLAACGRAEKAAPAPAATQAAPAVSIGPAAPKTPIAPAAFEEPKTKPARFAVFDVKSNDVLNVRAEADSKSQEVYSFGPSVKAVRTTGKASQNGTTQWVEVAFDGGTGWTNRAYLTEVVAGGGCNDPKLTAVIRQFMRAVAAEDGTVLSDAVSPVHGLIVRFAPENPSVRIPHDNVGGLFTSASAQNYGGDGGSDTPLTKPFKIAVLPTLKEAVAGKGAQEKCGKMLLGEGAEVASWPAEFESLTLVSFHTPGISGGWSSWVAGIEYVAERPYVTALVGYRRAI